MATLIQVDRRNVKNCDRCGTLITFATNRHGKRFPVEVHNHPGLGMVYRTGMGAYGNFTPWHKCGEVLQRRETAAKERREAALNALRNEVASKYLPRMMEIAQNFTPERAAEAEAVGREYAAALRAAEERFSVETTND